MWLLGVGGAEEKMILDLCFFLQGYGELKKGGRGEREGWTEEGSCMTDLLLPVGGGVPVIVAFTAAVVAAAAAF